MNKCLILAGLLGMLPALAQAQSSRFNNKDPIEITADMLEVQQLDNVATFSGNVVAIQNEVRLKSDRMIVYYTAQEEAEKKQGKQTVKKIDVEGNVLLATPEETASGDRGNYDVEGEMIHLYDNVVLTRDQNVLKGRELVYNFATGKSVVTGGAVAGSGESKGKERVRALIIPGSKDEKKP